MCLLHYQPTDEKLKVQVPETMQVTFMTDSEDEGRLPCESSQLSTETGSRKRVQSKSVEQQGIYNYTF